MSGHSSKRARFDDDVAKMTGERKQEVKAFDGVPAIQLALRADGGKPSVGIIEGTQSILGLESEGSSDNAE